MHLNECFEKEPFAALECIASDWLGKSTTNFYIPPEAYAGYTYLHEEPDRQPLLGTSARQLQQQSSTPIAQRRRHAFVHAKQINSLHHHSYHHNNQNRSIAMHFSDGNLPHDVTNVTSTMIPPNVNYHASFAAIGSQQHISAPITVPYMHPVSGRPVPPLQQPWFFGALCLSFSLGGIMKLYWTPRWTKHGGGCVNGKFQKHWFPFRTFALVLILLQGPCSFFADYIHMTNSSLWHLVDRLLACTCMLLHLGESVCSYRFTRPGIYLSYQACTAFAVVSFMNSQHAQSALDTEGFIFWHNCWHCFPLTLIVVCWFENVLNRRWGEYYHFKIEHVESVKRGENGGVLLSEIAMTSTKLRRSRRLAGKEPEML